MRPCEAFLKFDDGGLDVILVEDSATKKKAVLMTYLDPCIHPNGVFCLLKVSQTSGISFALFLPEPLLGRPLFCENRGHVRSELRISVCVY